MLSVLILALIFLAIAIRQIGRVRLQIWQIMLAGALLMLLTLQTTVEQAIKSINIDVMLFLFGVFVIGYALETSGYLSYLAYKVFEKARSVDALVLVILFAMGFASALLLNDTLAIIGTAVVLLFAKQHRVKPQLLLLALAFAVTIGSVMSPIGNPQNLLIAINGGMHNPFITFLRHLFIPTVLNLLVAYILLRIFYRKEFHGKALVHTKPRITDQKLAHLARLSLWLLVLLVLVRIGSVIINMPPMPLPIIALLACAPLLLFSPKRFTILHGIDWKTLVFFAAMFIVMDAVWQSGIFQQIIGAIPFSILSIGMVLAVSIVLSQFISNVPLVALYLPVLLAAGAGTEQLVALAAGSTIAGNLFILGAASNVIIIQQAEERGYTVTFWEFARIGIPLTVLNALVYWCFLA